MKRVISALFAVIILCLSVTPAFAADFGCEIDPVCDAVYLEELSTGTVVYTYNADEQIYPASTTKIMTFIVVAENVEDLDHTMVEVTEESLADLDPESSVMGLQYHIGESFSVRDLLYGLMLPSGNDAALVLAEYVGGDVDSFVAMMNRKAAQIGCAHTHFTSPHGLHDAQHYTTAREMAVMTKYAMKNADFMEICNTVSYKPEGFNEAIKTTNYLLDQNGHNGDYYYPYAKGIKTGYTDQAGRCLVSTAEKDGYTYLCIAMGADYSYSEDINYAMLDAVKFYDWAFENLAVRTAYDSTDVIRSVPVEYVWGNKMLDLVPESTISSLLPKDYDPSLLTITPTYTKVVATAPVEKGEVYGTLTVTYDNEVIGKTNIIASEDVDKQFTNYVAVSIIGFIRGHVVLTVVIVLAIIVVIILIIRMIKKKRARRSRHSRARINRER